ncbi:hypothetical protein BRD00_00225 [Halobacteriales archaeon QS_8_69_26]|nr:MAG: hypothetical protein BRD00_00225 [Halobacteriales archaeon QS_8_69_26]
MESPTRRRLLSTTAATVGTLVALAGCSGDGGDDGTPTPTDEEPTTRNGETTTTRNGGTTTTTDGGTTTDDGTTEATSPPDAEIQFVYDADEETLMMVNSGVEAFTEENTDRLVIRVDGEERTTWELPVEPSDQNSVEVAPGSTVEVVWIGATEVVVATHET